MSCKYAWSLHEMLLFNLDFYKKATTVQLNTFWFIFYCCSTQSATLRAVQSRVTCCTREIIYTVQIYHADSPLAGKTIDNVLFYFGYLLRINLVNEFTRLILVLRAVNSYLINAFVCCFPVWKEYAANPVDRSGKNWFTRN